MFRVVCLKVRWNLRFMCSYHRDSKFKITVCGAAGKIGKIVSLFLKQSPYPIHLSLHDISPSLSNTARQLASINSKNSVESFMGPMRLRAALKDSDIVLILTKARHYSKASSGDTFELNFPIVSTIIKSCIEASPEALIAIGTYPLNCIIPAVQEMYKNFDVWHSNKIIGITATDSMQAASVYAEMYSLDPDDVFVPIAGGTTVETILPLFSQSRPTPPSNFSRDEAEKLTSLFLERKSQEAVSELVSAYATYRFVESMVRALNGEPDIVECGFVASTASPSVKFMTSLIDLTDNGIANVYGMPSTISRYERKLYQTVIENLQRDFSQVEVYLTAGNYHIANAKLKLS